jgi:hypothetical protein
MKTKLTIAKTLVLGVIFGLLIGFVVWNVERVSAIKEVEGRVHFGIVTVLPATQNARLNFVRVDRTAEDPTEMQPCVVEIRNFDANNRAVGTPDTFELRPGIAVTRDVIPTERTGIEGRFQFRATFKIIPPDVGDRRCVVIPTLEVFSRETGGTLFNYPAAQEGFNSQSAPSGQN